MDQIRGMLDSKVGRDGFQLRLRLADRHTRIQPAGHGDEPRRTPHLKVVEAERSQKLGVVIRKPKIGPHDTDDGGVHAIHQHGPVQNVLVPAESLSPQAIAENNYRRRVVHFGFGGQEEAAHEGLKAQHG